MKNPIWYEALDNARAELVGLILKTEGHIDSSNDKFIDRIDRLKTDVVQYYKDNQ